MPDIKHWSEYCEDTKDLKFLCGAKFIPIQNSMGINLSCRECCQIMVKNETLRFDTEFALDILNKLNRIEYRKDFENIINEEK